MSNPFADSLELLPEPSRRLLLFVYLTHAAAMVVLVVLSLRQPWLLLLALPVVCSCWWHARWAGMRMDRAVRRLVWRADGHWLLQYADGECVTARLRPSTIALPGLVILHFDVPDRVLGLAVPLPGDSLAVRQSRLLRARLRLAY